METQANNVPDAESDSNVEDEEQSIDSDSSNDEPTQEDRVSY